MVPDETFMCKVLFNYHHKKLYPKSRTLLGGTVYYYTTHVGTVGVLGALGGEGLWNSKYTYICFPRNLYS